jgi:cytochrome c-type biogenesis protein CcmE
MRLFPKSRTARRRLMTLAVAAPVLLLALVAMLLGSRASISLFYTPSQAAAAHVPAGQTIELGGLVRPGSVVRKPDGELDFVVADPHGAAPVVLRHGDVPDLFREGQGVVAKGAFDGAGVFMAMEIFAKHDEKYMPPELTAALKKQGDWRGAGGQAPTGYGR